MKFMLLLRDHQGMFADKSPAEMPAVIDEYLAWGQKMRADGRVLGGEKLNIEEPGRLMREESGTVVVQSGGYSETIGIVGGFFILQAESYDEACRLAETNPQLKYGGLIEVRQLDEV